MTTPERANEPPNSNEVNRFHTNADRDTAKSALHHTLGLNANQSAPGDHTHDGRNSKLILQGKASGFPSTASGSYSQSEIQAIIDALRELGAGL